MPSRNRLSPSDFVSAGSVITEPKPNFLIEGLLFPRSPFSMFGLPGTGKSLIALYMAVCVAARRPFVERRVNLPQPASVVYVAAEGKAFIGARLRAIRDAHNISADDLTHLHILRRPVGLTDLVEVEQFVDTLNVLLRNRPPAALVIFDTLTKCLGRSGANENDPRDMALLADRIDAIAEATGAAVGFIDHTGWNGQHERGHSNKRGNVETAMLVTRDSKGFIKLESEKANHHEGFLPIRLCIDKRADAAVVMMPAPVRVSMSLGGIEASRRKDLGDNDKKALIALSGETFGLAFTRWQQTSGVSSATLARAKQRLQREGFIELEGPPTKPRYKLTAEGRLCVVESEGREQ